VKPNDNCIFDGDCCSGSCNQNKCAP
jgi:hypothetical protein